MDDMIPILFSPEETSYDSNGLGRLSDAISCIVTEERNGLYELDMIYPVDGNHFSDIQLGCQILARTSGKAEQQAQPFEIVNIKKTLDKQIDVYAVHISYRMSYIPVKPIEESGSITVSSAISKIKSKIAGSNPFVITTDKSEMAKFCLDEPTSLKSVLYGQEGSLLDMYGGTWFFDRFTATLMGQRGVATNLIVRYGKDLTSMTYKESREEIFTGVLPYWKGSVQEDGEKESQEIIVVADDPIMAKVYADILPYTRIIPLDVTQKFEQGDFDKKPSKSQVVEKGKAYVKENVVGTEEISVNFDFAMLWQTSGDLSEVARAEVGLCDEITIIHQPLGILYSGKVVKTVYNVLSEKYDSVDIGLLQKKIVDVVGERL